jgi:predicted PurR-regulated permease PerM
MDELPDLPPAAIPERMPAWVWRAVVIFWLGFIATIVGRYLFSAVSGLLLLMLVSLFLSLAIEPGVNRLAHRGWRRGVATAVILFGVFVVVLVFVAAIGTLVGSQVADLLGNSEKYVNKTVTFLNHNFNTNLDPKDVIASIKDPNGKIQKFIASQRAKAVQLSITALGVMLQGFSVLLFTFYSVAHGPRMRRAICSRLPPERQRRVLQGWDLAIDKTGGYLYSRALLAGMSTLFHWIVFQAVGTQAPVALALWVGLIGQFLPVVGSYIAGALPVLVTFIDSPTKAIVVLALIVLYRQVQNYLFAPRILARTMELHPAIAFGAALAGGAILGGVGAVLALPAAAMAQAIISNLGPRYAVLDDRLTSQVTPAEHKQRRRMQRRATLDGEPATPPTPDTPRSRRRTRMEPDEPA